MISVELLKKINTVSALKLLIFLHEQSNEAGLYTDSVKGIVEKSGLARNSVNRALSELEEAKIIASRTGVGNRPNTYKVSKVVGPKVDYQSAKKTYESSNVEGPKVDSGGWKKAYGARKEEPSSSKVDTDINIINNNIDNKDNILLKDFKEFNFINNNINSLSTVNENLYLTDEQLGKLARRILIEWFLPLASLPKNLPNYFFPQQMKILKDLLVEYNTEQVLAAIKYWTKINPPTNGMKSIKWLTYSRKNTSYVMIALDYFKTQYLEKDAEIEEEARLKLVEEKKKSAIEIAKQKVEERKKVEAMSNEDFLSDLLGGLGKIDIGGN